MLSPEFVTQKLKSWLRFVILVLEKWQILWIKTEMTTQNTKNGLKNFKMFMLRNQKKFRMHILLLLQVNNILRRHNCYYFLYIKKEQLVRCSFLFLQTAFWLNTHFSKKHTPRLVFAYPKPSEAPFCLIHIFILHICSVRCIIIL